ncbi:MAG TPA: flagellar brake protein [Gammaproteobacteria bacterium]|nr:flagellar brake protein [Gammaproteobacteria bacterium]
MEDKREFKVKLGDPVQLQLIPDDGRDRLNAKIIGHANNKSLIITAPGTSGGKLALLRENQRFVVRMLQGNRVYGFESEILKFYTLPFPHIHLSHPKDVESIVVRGAQRVQASNLVVSVQSDKITTAVAATLLNLSASGALMQCAQVLGKLDDKLTISLELDISGIRKYLRIGAIIRNLSTPEDREAHEAPQYRYGLQFLDLDEDQRLILTAYVYEQIIKQLED